MDKWPRDDNILSWDPEKMEHYWELCHQYDQYPQLDINAAETLSAKEFQPASVELARFFKGD